jgi:hypothetical protein
MDYSSVSGLVSGVSSVKHVTTTNKVPLPPEVMEHFNCILFGKIVCVATTPQILCPPTVCQGLFQGVETTKFDAVAHPDGHQCFLGRPRFNPRELSVGLVVNTVALGQNILSLVSCSQLLHQFSIPLSTSAGTGILVLV